MYNRTIAKNPSDLDSILEAFERENEVSGGADVVAFLPDSSDPAYQQVAVELIRVDLERSWARGSKKRLDAYREITPLLFTDPRRLAEIAFEEYRLRKQSGEAVTAAEYKRRYAIDISVWPDEDHQQVDRSHSASIAPTHSLLRTGDVPEFPLVGDSFAGFNLIEQLGRGAFGVVFRAKQSDLAAREVVLKITAPRSVEPQRLARLQHTNIVPLYSMHEHGGLLAICMPYFGRQTLDDVVRGGKAAAEQAGISTVFDKDVETLPLGQKQRTGSEVREHGTAEAPPVPPMGVDSIVDLVAQLAEGLAHAHERGIVHSDLKPANVLLTDDGVAMLLDFNLSSDSSSHQKATLLVGGTLPYMAPEHLLATLNGGTVGAASDVFSLGVIAFELLTGQRPFPDRAGGFDQTVDALVADRQKKVPSVRSFKPRVSVGLSAIVARCLESDVTYRYASAAQLAEDLRRYQQDLPLRHAADRSIRERSGKWLRRNARAVRWAVAASLVGLLASLSVMYMARQNRLADLEAATSFTEFENDAKAALLNLYAPGTEPELHTLGQTLAKRAVEKLGLIRKDSHRSATLSRLTQAQQSVARHQGVELLYALAASQSTDQLQIEDSIRYNTAALALLPSDSSSKSLLEQRTKLLKAARDTTGASQAGERARRANPDQWEAYLAAARLLEKGNYADAVVAWEKLCNQNRRDPLNWLLLGNAYVGAGRLANAEACYTALIALEPTAMNGYLYRGLCRANEGKFPDAESDYTEALLLNPSVVAIRINRALTYFALRNFEAADRDASAAIAAGLADPRAYFVRALIRDAMGKRDEAKADRKRGLAIQPIDDKGWVARGISLLRDDPQQAAREFEQGIQHFPISKPLLQNLVHVYGDRLNRPDDALRYSDQIVALSPNDSSALASRAVIQARNGSVEAALRDGERAAASQPSALTSLQLACVYSLVSRTRPEEVSQAIRHLQRALASDPKLARRAATDTDLTALQNNSEFQSILAAAAKLTDSAPSPTSPATKSSGGLSPAPVAHDDASKHSS